jgi:acyl-CoA reductase-like NAD-dependent aldehyde dehydrogenase
VFEPMTGDVQAKVALASKAEVRAAVENAKAAQPAWAATNPQRRARVMMKFLELAQRDYDKLADCWRASTARPSRRQGRHPARPRSGRIRLRHSRI